VIHRHVCSCGDYRLCKDRDCVPGEFEQCPECQQQEQDELDRERLYRARIAARTDMRRTEPQLTERT
jgi:hypothetical protein